MIIGDAPGANRAVYLGISNFEAGKVGGKMPAEAIGGEGRVILGSSRHPRFWSGSRATRPITRGPRPRSKWSMVSTTRSTPPMPRPPTASRLLAHPDAVGIGGTDGDGGKVAAIAVNETGRKGQVKIVAMDRNDDMLPCIEDGMIVGAVVQKSYVEAFLAVHPLHWLNTNGMKVVPTTRPQASTLAGEG